MTQLLNTLMRSNSMSIARQFITKPSSTGALAPASTQLAEAMVNAADLAQHQYIVELGPGTGAVTEVINASRAPDSEFFALELNPAFAVKTRHRCPGIRVYEDNALNLPARLLDDGVNHCDCILSSLPWTLFDEQLQQRLLDVIASALKPGGTFITYAYAGVGLHPAGRRFAHLMRDTFSATSRSGLIWNNIPPALVYTCTN